MAAHALGHLLARHFGSERLEDTAVSLDMVPVAFDSGVETLHTTEPIVEAVMASVAIPGIFPPV